MQKIWFLYFWRLEKEKWFDAIIDMISLFSADWSDLPFELFIFWTWTYSSDILSLAHQFPQIHYFWRQDLSTIKRYIPNCQYCLMPSTFLETFGLTALTARSRWLPVIAYKKWWLIPFVQEEYDLSIIAWKTTAHRLYNIILKILDPQFKPSNRIFNTSWYTSQDRRDRFYSFSKPGSQKILMVSDFINKAWGIETYIHDVREKLVLQWFHIKLFGSYLPSWFAGRLLKYSWIARSLFNLYQAIKLYFTIKKYKPDLIWYNSVLRNIGWLPIWVSSLFSTPKRMFYHDFGYVYPYPYKLTSTSQIHYPLTYKNFTRWQKSIHFILASAKYLTVKLLQYMLQSKIDLHLVPSEFMIPIISKSYQLPKDKIKSFPHFIQS